MKNDLRAIAFRHWYAYISIFWHLNRALNRQVALSTYFIFKMVSRGANFNVSVVHDIYSFTQRSCRLLVGTYIPSKGIPISILINVLKRTRLKWSQEDAKLNQYYWLLANQSNHFLCYSILNLSRIKLNLFFWGYIYYVKKIGW